MNTLELREHLIHSTNRQASKILNAGLDYTPEEEVTEGLRFDKGKNKLELIPPEWIWALGLVLTQGAKKYAPRNWELGMDYSKVMGPLERHLAKYKAGEKYDMIDADGTEGTRCHHMAIVAWNALVLMSYDLRQIGNDDVTKGEDFIKIFDEIQKEKEDDQ